MATNGVVSVTHGGRVVVKAVCGCDGYNAPELARLVSDFGDCSLTAEHVYLLALDAGFGCPDCLVVMDSDGDTAFSAGDAPALYAEKFTDPRFNPRCEGGTAAHVEVVEV